MEFALSFFDNYPLEIIQRDNYIPIKTFKSVLSADPDSLVFVASSTFQKDYLIRETKAITILCDSVPKDVDAYKGKCLLITNNPKLVFAKIVDEALRQDICWGIHPTAVIHPEAKIHPNTLIGPFVHIGKSEIGEGTVIHSNVSIYDNVTIGKYAIIDSGTVIGAAGFGYVKDENSIPIPFPQLGGVIIGDNVEIGANVCIDRGALENTMIGDDTKIDNLSHIAHNDKIGERLIITAGVIISGSTVIGDEAWLAPNCSIMQKLQIGNNVCVGLGASVIRNIKSQTTVFGNPAKTQLTPNNK